jgi:hypothetical protein
VAAQVANLFGMLLPELPKLYKGKGLQLDLSATAPPLVRFSADGGVKVQAEYQTRILVLDAAGDGQDLQVGGRAAWLPRCLLVPPAGV